MRVFFPNLSHMFYVALKNYNTQFRNENKAKMECWVLHVVAATISHCVTQALKVVGGRMEVNKHGPGKCKALLSRMVGIIVV